MRVGFGLIAAAAALACAGQAEAEYLTGYTANNTTVTGYVGQSFVIPFIMQSTPYIANLSFSFLNNSGAIAPGKLYIFTAPFAGNPTDLSTVTPTNSAIYAVATGNNGTYSFDNTKTFFRNSVYYAYSDTILTVSGTTFDGYGTGNSFLSASYAPSSSTPFSMNTNDVDFLVTGSLPEPAGWAMMIAGVGMVGAFARRRQRQATRPVVMA